MMITLEDLYYGNIIPAEYNLKKGSAYIGKMPVDEMVEKARFIVTEIKHDYRPKTVRRNMNHPKLIK